MENGIAAAQKLVPYSAYEEAYRLMGSTSYTPVPEKKKRISLLGLVLLAGAGYCLYQYYKPKLWHKKQLKRVQV